MGSLFLLVGVVNFSKVFCKEANLMNKLVNTVVGILGAICGVKIYKDAKRNVDSVIEQDKKWHRVGESDHKDLP